MTRRFQIAGNSQIREYERSHRSEALESHQLQNPADAQISTCCRWLHPAKNLHAHTRTHSHTEWTSRVVIARTVCSKWGRHIWKLSHLWLFLNPSSLSGAKCWDVFSKYIKRAVWNEKRSAINWRQPWKSFTETLYTLSLFFFLSLDASLFLTKSRASKTQYLRIGESLFFHQTKTEQNFVIINVGCDEAESHRT